ncbi:transposable element Tc3 transposase [Trichonephila clavipes]|nr:transposable element Tc3 transposase [Trichonephila clavipes]
MNKGKLTSKLKDLQQRHKTSLSLSTATIIENESGYIVPSSSTHETYVIQDSNTNSAANHTEIEDFQCNNRIVMAQSIWMIFYVVELLDDWSVDVPSWKYPRNLESPRVSSPGFRNDSKMMVPVTIKKENTIERHGYGGGGWLVWGGIILGSRTDQHVQSVTMTGHIYRDVILEQHVRLFWGVLNA